MLSLAKATVRWVGGRRLMLPLTGRFLCARIVREWPVFFARELIRPSGVRYYHLRESGRQVVLRHAALDAATLTEIFYRYEYRPREDVASAIGDPRSILDLGANVGLFGVFASSYWPRSTIVGYEADPDNVAVHERAIAANGLQQRWRVIAAAAGASDGEVELANGRAMGSFVVEEGTDPGVPTIRVPVRDVLADVCAADLVKIDVEGGEWAILLDPRFVQSPPRALVVEYHPHLCPEPDPRGAAERALTAAAMTVHGAWHRPDGYGMLWAWRA
jgi:FkbM family methyltransferase